MQLSRRKFLTGCAAVAVLPPATRQLIAVDWGIGKDSTALFFKSNTCRATISVNGLGAQPIEVGHGLGIGDVFTIAWPGKAPSVWEVAYSTTTDDYFLEDNHMSFIQRILSHFAPRPPVLMAMPPHVRAVNLNPSLLGLHMAHTDKPDKATATGLAPKAPTVPAL